MVIKTVQGSRGRSQHYQVAPVLPREKTLNADGNITEQVRPWGASRSLKQDCDVTAKIQSWSGIVLGQLGCSHNACAAAVADAEQQHGLRSHPKAPIVQVIESPETAIQSKKKETQQVIILANVLWAIGLLWLL